MTSDDRGVGSWLQEFEAACRARDFDTARGMFAEDALAFGTWARAVHGLLARHPLVVRFFTAPAERGGWGATVAILKGPDQPSSGTGSP